MKILIALILCFGLIGCSTATLYKRYDKASLNLENKKEFKEIVVSTSYNEAFRATLSVFRDFNMTIIKKDYDKKQIIANMELTGAGGMIPCYYGIFFEVQEEYKTKIISKAEGSTMYEDKFILSKIQDEIELQKKINK